MPFSLLKIILKKPNKQLTLGNLTNIRVQVSPTCTTNTTKHAPFTITEYHKRSQSMFLLRLGASDAF